MTDYTVFDQQQPRHPLEVKWDIFQLTEQGRQIMNHETIQVPLSMRSYFVNRIHAAFFAGAAAEKEHILEQIRLL
jgi:hypothetical protein